MFLIMFEDIKVLWSLNANVIYAYQIFIAFPILQSTYNSYVEPIFPQIFQDQSSIWKDKFNRRIFLVYY